MMLVTANIHGSWHKILDQNKQEQTEREIGKWLHNNDPDDIHKKQENDDNWWKRRVQGEREKGIRPHYHDTNHQHQPTMQTPIPRKLETKQQEAIISNLETTIGKTKTRTDKPRKPTDAKTKRVKLRKKAAKKAFQIACNEGQDATKATKLKEYLEAQTTYRMAVEACERSRTEKRTETLVKKATIGPNEIWQARKRSQSRNELEYNTITEEAETLTDPEKIKEYIADYFEELYQARPGAPEYEFWTKHITDTMR